MLLSGFVLMISTISNLLNDKLQCRVKVDLVPAISFSIWCLTLNLQGYSLRDIGNVLTI